MADREKLIELLDKTFAEQYDKRGLLTAVHTADDLISNGVIVLPCKPGDTVYAYCEYFGVLPYLVGNFHIGYMGKHEDCWHWEAAAYAAETDELLDEIDFDLEDIGKDVFFTREEAEKALKERAEK